MSHSEPKLLYAVKGIKAYHIQNGTETTLTPSGPQTLSLLMVPTSSPFSGIENVDPSGAPQEDFYLHLHLPPELDLPLPATTQIYHQPPSSYLIPRWDLGVDNGAFTRIEFPAPGSVKGLQEDVDTFETILAQCTAFLERAPAPEKSRKSHSTSTSTSKGKAEAIPSYNPQEFAPGEGYVQGSSSSHQGGQIVLIDEENGSVVGELGEGFNVVEDSKMQAGSKSTYPSRSQLLQYHAYTNIQILSFFPSPKMVPVTSASRPRPRNTLKWPCIPPTKIHASCPAQPPRRDSSSQPQASWRKRCSPKPIASQRARSPTRRL